MIDVDIICEDERWDRAGLERLAVDAVTATLTHLGVDGEREIVIMGCDDARIAELNADFRGKPRPTNVLSWPSEERGAEQAGAVPELPGEDDDPELGDIAIAWETTLREADDGGIPLDDHVRHLIVHATLHLLGYDHERDADGDLMEATEVAILAGLGVPDPYQGTTPRNMDLKDG